MILRIFVHGALCVSYSGVCYASEKCFGRSANRGECAQFCRMKFNLIDSNENEIEHERHLLSLKDLCQIDHLQELADAGATSFKIEGRLTQFLVEAYVGMKYSHRTVFELEVLDVELCVGVRIIEDALHNRLA